eukprot:CAMPEP_0168361376 /NCGR_PEP_ID=MMETSP0228-20121227/2635_1 /TAXON_ID=133427 /ORGANISM="Protoceratium reticulatum, Strain CCCM 535 (=CCMP 1889)" /LENGTH=286 /DNA_ID=CAMNT_0008374053 /DNA_START=53 /DNA_END=910 /DNA_ORIENTATION=-
MAASPPSHPHAIVPRCVEPRFQPLTNTFLDFESDVFLGARSLTKSWSYPGYVPFHLQASVFDLGHKVAPSGHSEMPSGLSESGQSPRCPTVAADEDAASCSDIAAACMVLWPDTDEEGEAYDANICVRNELYFTNSGRHEWHPEASTPSSCAPAPSATCALSTTALPTLATEGSDGSCHQPEALWPGAAAGSTRASDTSPTSTGQSRPGTPGTPGTPPVAPSDGPLALGRPAAEAPTQPRGGRWRRTRAPDTSPTSAEQSGPGTPRTPPAAPSGSPAACGRPAAEV